MPIINNPQEQDQSKNPWIALISLFLMVFGGTIIFGFLLSTVLLLPFELDSISRIFANIDKGMDADARNALMVFQGCASLGGFVIAPALFLIMVAKIKPTVFFHFRKIDLGAIFLTGIIVILFMVLDSPIIEWNSNFKFPSFLSDFESMALNKELELAKLTEALTSFENLSQFFLGMLVIAIIPAIGEEFLFRGLIQNYFLKIFGNYHTAIWIAAIIFGVFHMQFYGVVPRILLGALFGYLYVWSGSLWIPVIAHFVNNGFTLLMSYLYQRGGIPYDIQETSTPPLYLVLLALIVFAGMIYYFRKKYFIKIN